jgi:molecular chaperone GrpE
MAAERDTTRREGAGDRPVPSQDDPARVHEGDDPRLETEPPQPQGDPLGEATGVRPHHEPAEPPAEEDGAAAEGEVEADLAELTARRDEYLALAQRTQADFENYRKRMAKEVRVAEARGMSKLARELLPALDTLHLALDRSGAEAGGPLGEGVRLVLGELMAALARAGIEAYSPHGESFDPQVHEAVGQRPAEDGEEAGTVVEVMQQGYRHGETVLRPARVFVAG